MMLARRLVAFVIAATLAIQMTFGLKCLTNWQRGVGNDRAMNASQCDTDSCLTTVCEHDDDMVTALKACNRPDVCNIQRAVCASWDGQVADGQDCSECRGALCNAGNGNGSGKEMRCLRKLGKDKKDTEIECPWGKCATVLCKGSGKVKPLLKNCVKPEVSEQDYCKAVCGKTKPQECVLCEGTLCNSAKSVQDLLLAKKRTTTITTTITTEAPTTTTHSTTTTTPKTTESAPTTPSAVSGARNVAPFASFAVFVALFAVFSY